MKIDFSVEEAVGKRTSIRNYQKKALGADVQRSIQAFASTLDNPFGREVHIHFLDQKDTQGEKILGTYGVIQGADQYIGASISLEDLSLEALGYEMEVLILYLASLGLGSCWLGGTFNRQAFAQAMEIGEDEIFPIITPYGYGTEKKHLLDRAMRRISKSHQRKAWSELFFQGSFDQPLTPAGAGDLDFPLEMLRLAPSASNLQPWRLLVDPSACHFFEYKKPGYSAVFPYDIQRIDLGIAAAHFDLAAQEKGLEGSFQVLDKTWENLPKHIEYVFSWLRKD